MTGVHDGAGELRKREFRRFVGWSAGAHLLMLGLAVVNPSWRSEIAASDVISVDIVSLPPSAALPAPPAPSKPAPPAETPPPPPKPEPPKPDKTVIPVHPEREPDKPKRKPKPEQPKPAPEKSLEDLLADMRKDAGETEPAPAPAEPAPQATAAATSGVASAGTVKVSPEVLDWMRRTKVHVKSVWVVPPGFRREALETRVLIELDASGAVLGEPQITKRSGNPWFDDGVVRAVEKASPLPSPPRAGEWELVFLPEDAS